MSSIVRVFRGGLPLLVLALTLVSPWSALAAAPDVGQPAPDFIVQTLAGTPFELAGHRGRTVVLMFTAPGCVECIAELEALSQIHADYTARGVDILVLNIDPYASAQDLVAFKDSIGVAEYPWALDGAPLALTYGVQALSTTVIVDPEGQVAYLDEHSTDFETYRAALAPLVASPISEEVPACIAPGWCYPE